MNPTPAPNEKGVTPEKPWLGLRSFSEEVRGYFFGRDSELLDLFERVEHKPLTVFFGRSGLGKTSLLHAGLLPRLRDAGFLPVDLRLRYDDAPPLGQQVIDEIRSALDGAGLPALPQLPPDTSLWLLFHDRACGIAGSELRFVLIFDQFEEIFTLGDDQLEASRAFRDALAAVVENRVPDAVRERLEKDDALAERLSYSAEPCRVLLSLRDDFLHRLERWRRHMPSLMDNRVELRPLTGPQALEAVVLPGRLRCAAATGGPGEAPPPIVSEETGAAIVRFVAGATADLPIEKIETVPPLLSLICAELNEARIEANDDTIHADQLQGKADSILEKFYNDCFAEHPPALRKFVEEFLLSKEGYRESVAIDTPLHELEAANIARDDARRMLSELIDRRLLAVEERGNVRRLELTHDVLIGVAKRSRDTRHEREEREERERQERERAKRAQAKAEEEASRRSRQFRRRVFATLLVLVCASVVAFYIRKAKDQGRQAAESAKQAAETGDQLVKAALVDHATALAFFEQSKWREGIAYLGRSLSNNPDSEAAATCLWMAVVYGRGERHPRPLEAYGEPEKTEKIVCAVFNPQLTRVLTVRADNTATICDPSAGRPLRTFTFTDPDAVAGAQPDPTTALVAAATFSPDGKRVVIVNKAGRASVWDVEAASPSGIALTADDRVLSAAFADEGRHIVAACLHRRLRKWNIDGTAIGPATNLELPAMIPPAAPSGNEVPGRAEASLESFETMHPAIVSPDGSRIAIRTGDKRIAVWEVDTGHPRYYLGTRQDWMIPIAFSPDGKQLVTMDANRAVSVATEPPVGRSSNEPLRASRSRDMTHEADVQSAFFSSDGLRLVTVCGDDERPQTAHVWNARDGVPLDVALDHENPICAVAFSVDGSRVLTVDDQRNFRSWNPVAGYSWGEPIFDDEQVRKVQDAEKAASVGGVQLLAKEFPGMFHTFDPISVAIDKGHGLVATCHEDSIGIWDKSGAALSPPLFHSGKKKFAGFDPSGTEIVTASAGNITRIWSLPKIKVGKSAQPWIEDFTREISRLKFGHNQILETVPADEPPNKKTDAWPAEWSALLHWSRDSDPAQHVIAPGKNLTNRAVANQLLQLLDRPDWINFNVINEVLAIDPTNPRRHEAIPPTAP